MNKQQLVKKIFNGTLRVDIGDIGDYINSAMRTIQQSRNWSFMSATAILTVDSIITELPPNFKCFKSVPYPIKTIDSAGNITGRLELVPKQMAERLGVNVGLRVIPSTAPFSGGPDNYAYLDYQNGLPTLNLLRAPSTPQRITIDYYGFLPDLIEDDDNNVLTVEYPWVIIHRAKADIFAEINDDGAAAASETQYSDKRDRAAKDDARRVNSGATITM